MIELKYKSGTPNPNVKVFKTECKSRFGIVIWINEIDAKIVLIKKTLTFVKKCLYKI